ncbi:MAG: hypothetical protein AB8B52_14485 [Winogradskyella sp.]|uniref:hypothetical protein n=1 Tax=Winogradskyella sp. TaxID=1883156 RepID=UPI0038582F4D
MNKIKTRYNALSNNDKKKVLLIAAILSPMAIIITLKLGEAFGAALYHFGVSI